MKDNFLDIPRDRRERPVYRVFPIHRIIEAIEAGQNTLVKPVLWDDPFENFLLSVPWKLPDGTPFNIGARDQMYGQCWTWQRETDAMWRIYSTDKQGVKVRSTARRLLESLWGTVNYPELSCFIGNVDYRSQLSLKRMPDDERFQQVLVDQTGRSIAQTLLFKRPEFKHEKELRIILYRHDKCYIREKVYQYPIRVFELFDEFVLDPRLPPAMATAFRAYFKSVNCPHEVKQSRLYTLPAAASRPRRFNAT